MSKLQNRIQQLSTLMLKNVAKGLIHDHREESTLVLSEVLCELLNRISLKEFEAFEAFEVELFDSES